MTKELGWNTKEDKLGIEISRRTKETYVQIKFYLNPHAITKKKYNLDIVACGDLEHHLIEDAMLVLNKLATEKGIGHQIKLK